jgi:hypothetical protein
METKTTRIAQSIAQDHIALLKLAPRKKGATNKSLLPHNTTAYFAAKISEEYHRLRAAAATIGRLLIEAKAALPH